MGAHKHNPAAQLAKEGKLPLKPKLIGKAEARRSMEARIKKAIGLDKLEKVMSDMDFH